MSKLNNNVKTKKLSPTEQLMNKMNISETYTKPITYRYPKVKNQIFPKSGYNYESDLLELPKTKDGYNALLVVDDLYSNYLDFEPLKSKSAQSVLQAIKTIFKRGIVPEPKASIRTDSGGEFKSVVDKYMHDHNILHLWSLPDRHKMMGNVENLNRQIGRFLMTYLSNKSDELNTDYTDWTDKIDELRHGLNEIKKHPQDVNLNKYVAKDINIENPPKFKVGDLVYRRLEKPIDKYSNKLHNNRFRAGDNKFEMVPRKIVKVLIYSSPNPYRFILFDLPNVSYAEAELLRAKESVEKFVVRKIIDKMTKNKIVYYNVWWKGKLKKDSTWESKANLLEDNCSNYINDYEDSVK
jgi:hypothetical protein